MSKTGSATKDKRHGKGNGITIVLLTIIAVCILLATYILMSYQQGDQIYDEIASDYTNISDGNANKEPSDVISQVSIDWDALKRVNKDVVGWIYVPGTPINYPIVWREGDDEYYMHRDFYDSMSGVFGARYGCIGLSGINKPDMTDSLNVLYGHHMRNGSMFAVFQDLEKQSRFDEIRYGYVFTPDTTFVLSPICVNKVSENTPDIVITRWETPEAKAEYLQKMMDNAMAKSGDVNVPALGDVFMTYTCSEPDDNNRILVYWQVVSESNPDMGSATQDANQMQVPNVNERITGNTLGLDTSKVQDVEGAVGERIN